MTAARAAHDVLDARLRAVESFVKVIGHERDPSPVQVHRLRVATRRADAALRSFRPVLKPKRARAVRRLLRRYRQGAAEARRADVQGAYLRSLRKVAPGARGALLDHVLAWLERRSVESRDRLRRVIRKRPRKKLKRARVRLLKGIDEGEAKSVSFAELARETVSALAQRMDDARRSGQGVVEDLHAHRLRGKRLRYALEVFAPCFGPEIDETYQRVRDMQDELGAINDLHEHADVLESFVDRHPDLEPELVDAAGVLAGEWRRERDDRARTFVASWRGAAAIVGGLLTESGDESVVGVLPTVSPSAASPSTDGNTMQRSVEPGP